MYQNLILITILTLISSINLTESLLKGIKRPPKAQVKEDEFPILIGPNNSATKACRCTPRDFCQDSPTSAVWSPRSPPPVMTNKTKMMRSPIISRQRRPPLKAHVNVTRIVNRPPKDGVCQPGEIYCCTMGPGHVYPTPPIYPDDPNQPGHNVGGCGTSKIIRINGWVPEHGQAYFGHYPWLAVIVGPNNHFIGAGALIDGRHVLTAAHKVNNQLNGGFKIRFGEWNAMNEDEPYKHIQVEVVRVDIHPAFNPTNLHNDLAILRLAYPISLTAYPHINSVCLPQPNAVSNYLRSRCWVAGYGKDDFKDFGKYSHILREVDVPIVDSNECEMRLRRSGMGSQYTLHRNSFMCAGGEDGKDACTGDGGSPLVCQRSDGKFAVVGLVAWGIGCADYEVPGIYVNVANYLPWIQSKLIDTGSGGILPPYVPGIPLRKKQH